MWHRLPTFITRHIRYLGRGDWKGWSPSQLKNFSPARKPMDWHHPVVDYDNKFYDVKFNMLWLMINDFAKRAFGNAGDNHSFRWTWHHDMSPEFSRFVEMVATSDTTSTNWVNLIDYDGPRQYLVAAVLAKIVAIYVFSELLFGATKEQSQHLKEQDRAMLSHDGMICS